MMEGFIEEGDSPSQHSWWQGSLKKVTYPLNFHDGRVHWRRWRILHRWMLWQGSLKKVTDLSIFTMEGFIEEGDRPSQHSWWQGSLKKVIDPLNFHDGSGHWRRWQTHSIFMIEGFIEEGDRPSQFSWWQGSLKKVTDPHNFSWWQGSLKKVTDPLNFHDGRVHWRKWQTFWKFMMEEPTEEGNRPCEHSYWESSLKIFKQFLIWKKYGIYLFFFLFISIFSTRLSF